MEEDKSRELMKKVLAEAQVTNNDRITKRTGELFDALDDAIMAEVKRGGPIESSVHWAALATLVAKTVMVQELQTGSKDTFDTSCLGLVEAARAVYKEGYHLEK